MFDALLSHKGILFLLLHKYRIIWKFDKCCGRRVYVGDVWSYEVTTLVLHYKSYFVHYYCFYLHLSFHFTHSLI